MRLIKSTDTWYASPFFWAAFAKGVADRRRQNEKEQVLPRLDKRGHWVRLRQLYNPDKIRQGIASGKMAINQIGDPLPKMDTIHSWLGELYNQVHKQMITTRVPASRNFGQQEKEIIQHFKEMWDDKQYDVYHLPVSVDDPDNLFTADEPYASGATAPYHQETEKMDYLDEDDPEEVSTLQQDSDTYLESEDDGTTTAQESTDAEIQKAMASVMISSYRDYRKLVGLSLEQSAAAMDAGWKAVEKIQTNNFEPDVETELVYFHSQRSESTWWVVKFKEDTGPNKCRHRQEEMPERGGAWPKERGRSTIKHQTTSSRQTPERSLAVGVFYLDTMARLPEVREDSSAIQFNTIRVNANSVSRPEEYEAVVDSAQSST